MAPDFASGTPGRRPTLTVIILTYNEALHIERAIACVKPLASRIVVVDSYSNDRTEALAEGCGAEVIQHCFINQARQMNWALENCGIDTDWILRLDADEIIGPGQGAQLHDAAGKAGKTGASFVIVGAPHRPSGVLLLPIFEAIEAGLASGTVTAAGLPGEVKLVPFGQSKPVNP